MDEALEVLAGLEAAVAAQESRLRRRIMVTGIVYVLVVVFVALYTSYLVKGIQDVTSTTAVAELAGSWLTQNLPRHRQAIVAQLAANSGTYARKAVRYSIDDLLPKVEEKTQAVMDQFTDMLAAEIQEELVPAFSAFLRTEAPQLKKQYAELNEQDTVNGMVDLFASVVGQELDQYLNARLVDHLGDLQKKINGLQRQKTGLTRREDAERRALIYWAVLADRGALGESPYEGLLDAIKSRLPRPLSFQFGAEPAED